MGLKAIGRIFRLGRESRTLFLSIPSRLATDKRFQFKVGDEVLISVEGRRIVVERTEA